MKGLKTVTVLFPIRHSKKSFIQKYVKKYEKKSGLHEFNLML